MSCEEQKKFERSDKVLDRNVLRKIGTTYAGTTVESYIEHKASHDYIMILKKEKVNLYYSMIKDFIFKE